MKRIAASLLLAAAATLCADIIKNPDANTLWKEDGKNVDKNWRYGDAGQHTRTSTKDGFTFECKLRGTSGHRDFITAPVSKEYPWLVFRMSSIKQNPGYRSWTLHINALDRFRFGQTSAQEPGIFAVNIWEGANLKTVPKAVEFYFYNYTLQLNFTELKMVKKPDNFIEASSEAFTKKRYFAPGDKIRFTVTLKDAAEDVSLRLVHPDLLFTAKFNGLDKIQLKPVDDTQKVWSGEFEVKSIGPVRKFKEFQRGDLMMRATVLGGGVSEPIWGLINFPYKLK